MSVPIDPARQERIRRQLAALEVEVKYHEAQIAATRARMETMCLTWDLCPFRDDPMQGRCCGNPPECTGRTDAPGD